VGFVLASTKTHRLKPALLVFSGHIAFSTATIRKWRKGLLRDPG